jgi:hypothetical protein
MRFTAFFILVLIALGGCSSGGGGGAPSVQNTEPPISLPEPSTTALTLTWQPPTENSDGTPLLDLAGYYIYLGRESEVYDDVLLLDNPGLTTFVIDNLEPGTYFLAATAFNASGVESSLSAELVVVVG